MVSVSPNVKLIGAIISVIGTKVYSKFIGSLFEQESKIIDVKTSNNFLLIN